MVWASSTQTSFLPGTRARMPEGSPAASAEAIRPQSWKATDGNRRYPSEHRVTSQLFVFLHTSRELVRLDHGSRQQHRLECAQPIRVVMRGPLSDPLHQPVPEVLPLIHALFMRHNGHAEGAALPGSLEDQLAVLAGQRVSNF